MLIPNLLCPAWVRHQSMLRMKQWIRPCQGTLGGIWGGGRRQDKDAPSHRGAPWGHYSQLIRILGRVLGTDGIWDGPWKRERILKEEAEWPRHSRYNGKIGEQWDVSGKSIHWNVTGVWMCQEVVGNEFRKPGDLALQAKQFEFCAVGNNNGME